MKESIYMDFREITEFIRDFIGYIITFIIIIFILTFVISLQPISGNSMYPTLKEGEFVLVNKLFYKIGKIKRNDIVNVVNDEGKSFVKRIIGLPGEKIHYMNGKLYIDDEPYLETYLNENIKTHNFLFEDICKKADCPEGIIPEDMYLVLGDNRPESEDSRTPGFGLRNKNDIKGVISFKIWPFSELGKIN